MTTTINKEIKIYCAEIKKSLACSSNIKLAFISELKNRIHEYIEEHHGEEITITDIEKDSVHLKILHCPLHQQRTCNIYIKKQRSTYFTKLYLSFFC